MARTQRPYPLLDEIKMHVYTWIADEDWKKLPVPVKESMNMLANEIKVHEAIKRYGGDDERLDGRKVDKKNVFFAIYKQKYIEFAGMEYSGSIDSATRFITGTLIQRLEGEGSTPQEYLDWFFDEFMTDEFNKQRYAPPKINVALKNDIVDKYIYLNKDKLKVRKQDIANYKVKNALMALATDYLKKNIAKEFGKDFGQKVLDYSRGTISLRRFSTIFINLLDGQGESKLKEEVLKIISEEREEQQ